MLATQMFPSPSMAIPTGFTTLSVMVAAVFWTPLVYSVTSPSTESTTQRLPDGSNATLVGALMPAVIVAFGWNT